MYRFQISLLVLDIVRAYVTDVWTNVPCEQKYIPENCNLTRQSYDTVEEYDRCAPARLSVNARNYFLGASGRQITYGENKAAYKRIQILPKMLRDVSRNSLEISTLGQSMEFPIGLSPVAAHLLANPLGEIASVKAVSSMKTIMIYSSYSTTRIEDVAVYVRNSSSHFWMQVYIFKRRQLTINLVRKAEQSGFKAIVCTIDSPVPAKLFCGGRVGTFLPDGVSLVNIPNVTFVNSPDELDPSLTFKDLSWLRSITKLPVIAKGLLSGDDAVRAIRAGASAILVSNHGGRQMDGAPATIDVLPAVVEAVNKLYPRRDVYIDGGIRNGFDVYKALARGAKIAFIGRPQIWGLATAGEKGVQDVLNILKNELNETMLLSGAANPGEIRKQSLMPSLPILPHERSKYNPDYGIEEDSLMAY